MNVISTCIVFAFIAIDVILSIWILVRGHTVALFDPKGTIALAQSHLIITALSVMLLFAIPTVLFAFFTAWKYKERDTDEKYIPTPTSHQKNKFQFIMWLFPISVVLFLAPLLWTNAHALDPSKPIASNIKPLTIQVVALQWKWLFIYPEEHIATINFIQFPVNTPVNFQLTADAPMSSFWIPQLAGQIYAMPGMGTQLHIMATSPGNYNGSAAEINGDGFSGMKFIAKASSQSDFDTWVQSIQQSPQTLTLEEYKKLARPSSNNPASYYSLQEQNLYNEIMMQFMSPKGINSTSQPTPMTNMPGMNMH